MLNFIVFYYGGAIALAIGLIVSFGLMLHAENRFGRHIVPLLVPLITLGICLGTVLAGRNLSFDPMQIQIGFGRASGTTSWALRVFTVLLLGLSAARIFGAIVRRERQADDAGARALFIAYLAYFAGNVVLNSAFGTVPAFHHNSVYPVVLFTALYVSRREPLERLLVWAKYALLAMMVGSVLVAAARPDMALMSNYSGWIPGVNFRFWGLGSHANSIGPLALLLMLLEWLMPSHRRLLRLAVWTTAAGIFVLAQSKTAWLAGIAVLPVLLWYGWRRSGDSRRDLGLALLAVLALAGVVLALAWIEPARMAGWLSGTQAGGDIATLTGRGQIWSAALDAWRENPLFGYGVQAWGPLHRLQLGMLFATSAHNQVMQVLSSAGLFGLLSLAVYLILLVVNAWRMAGRTRGVSLALCLVIVIRGITEAPLEFGPLLNGDLIAHAVLFAICVRVTAPRSRKQAQAALEPALRPAWQA